jgi:hypothetical protein
VKGVRIRVRKVDPEPQGFKWPKVDIRVVALISLFWIIMAVGDSAKRFEAEAKTAQCEEIMFRDVALLRSRLDALTEFMALREGELQIEHERMKGTPFLAPRGPLYGTITEAEGGDNDNE